MDKRYVFDILNKALDNASDPNYPVSSLILSARRVARLRCDVLNLWWIEYETCVDPLHQMKEISEAMFYKFSVDSYKANLLKFCELWENERTLTYYSLDDQNQLNRTLLPLSVSEIENRIRSICIGMNGGGKTLDANAVQDLEVLYNMLSHIKSRIIDFFLSTEQEIMLGDDLSHYFKENKLFVEGYLGLRNENYRKQFKVLNKRLLEEDEESNLQCLLVMRSVLKGFANYISPLPHISYEIEDEKEEILSDETYVERIMHSLFMKTRREVSAKLLHADLLDVVNRLETTNELACKGVRYGVSETEAHQSIIQAYILLGALIRACGD